MFGQKVTFDIDQCGHVNVISNYAAMLIPLYYFPLVILILLIIKKILNKNSINKRLVIRTYNNL